MTLMHQFYGAVLLQDDISMVTAAMTTGEEDHTPSLLVSVRILNHDACTGMHSLAHNIHTHQQESLYRFMGQRYQVPEVASLAIHDFISSLSEHHLHYKVTYSVN